MDFYTKTHYFRRMSPEEINELETGDKVTVCIDNSPPIRMEFVDAIVVKPLLKKKDSNSLNQMLETNLGPISIYEVYEVGER